ncbi:MAG: hypothetical protein RL637_40 [Pseudomonadota bacterium]|jgi:Uma2 family endonuclease
MSSFNHSYVQARILKQLFINQEIEVLPRLTLEIANQLTPDISVFKSPVQANFFQDITHYQSIPLLVINIVTLDQTIQSLLSAANLYIQAGVNYVWTIEPYTHSILVSHIIQQHLFHDEIVESDGIKVDFKRVFN